MDIITYALCKKIAAAAASGIDRMWVDGLTLYIQPKEGNIIEIEFPTPEDGVSIVSTEIDGNQHLICTMSDGTTIDAGEVPVYIPQKGVDYFTDEDKEEMTQEVKEEVSESLVLDII